MPPPADRTTILWDRLDHPGHEWCEIAPSGDGTRLSGVAVGALDDVPYRVEYLVELDAQGGTTRLGLTSWGVTEATLDLTADGAGRWHAEGGTDTAVDASDDPPALDVDLGFSPLTNSLPIWRLGDTIGIGDSRDIRVAWVLFPSLEVIEGRQTYTRLGEDRWHYRSKGFEAILDVAKDGLVERYAGAWQAVARG